MSIHNVSGPVCPHFLSNSFCILIAPTAVVWEEDYIHKTNVQNNTPSYFPEHTQPNMPAMQYFEKAQSSFKPPLVANENAFLGDVASS